MKVPEKIELSFFHYLKLRKLLHQSFFIHVYIAHNGLLQFITPRVGWLVGCFGFNGPLRQCFSLYRAVSQREGERGEIWLVGCYWA